MKFIPANSQKEITHSLHPHFPHFQKFPNLGALQKSERYRTNIPALLDVVDGVAWQNTHRPDFPTDGRFRVAAWNIERGIRLEKIIEAFQTHPELSRADILMITEADVGMGRSGNRNVPREMAAALGMNYCFSVSFLGLGKGDEGEQEHHVENELGLHGTALLSRYPIIGYRQIPLPTPRDYFSGLEKRLGSRKALLCRIACGAHPLDVLTVHLDLKCSPGQRGQQMRHILDEMEGLDSRYQIIGGDFNTMTYSLLSGFALLRDFLYKILFTGFDRTIANYMIPYRFFERWVFEELERGGFRLSQPQSRELGTLFYDIFEDYQQLKAQSHLPGFGFRWLQKKLSPWRDGVPLRLDWLATRGFSPNAEAGCGEVEVIPLRTLGPERYSDHRPLLGEFQLR